MSASRCIPGRNSPKSASSCPATQWSGLPRGDNRPRKEAVAVQIPAGEVERRSLEVYELVREVWHEPWNKCASTWRPWASSRPLRFWITPWTPRPASTLTYPEMLAELLGVSRPPGTLPHHSRRPIASSAEQFDFAFSPPSTSGWSRWPTWVAEATTSSCWDRPAWARPIWPSPWRCGPSRMATALTSSALRPDGGSAKARAEHNLDRREGPGTQGAGRGRMSASGPTTGSRPPPSSPWCRLATNVADASSRRTRASASGVNCWATA